jgi:hypothetical protein
LAIAWREATSQEVCEGYEMEFARLAAAWRISRELAILKGMIEPEGRLSSLSRKAWDSTEPETVPEACSRLRKRRAPLWEVARRVCGRPGSPGKRALPSLPLRVPRNLASVLFTPAPSAPRLFGKPPPPAPLIAPPPSSNTFLSSWLWCANRIADRLSLQFGPYGAGPIHALLNPERCTALWPPPQRIVDWEESVLESAVCSLARGGMSACRAWALDPSGVGLTSTEADDITRLALEEARSRRDAEPDAKRAAVELMVEDYISRSRAENDRSSEAKGIRLLAAVMGLTRTEPEDASRGFSDVVRSIGKPSAALLNGRAPSLLQNAPWDAEFAVVPHAGAGPLAGLEVVDPPL